MAVMNQIEELFAPWQAAYGDSTLISTTVTAIHLIAMLAAGGLALAADRATLRVTEEVEGERERHLGELNAIHRPVLIGLAVLVVSGVAMLTADIATFVTSPVYWVKMGLVVLLVFNGVVLERTETALRTGQADAGSWKKLRLSATTSVFLWIATLVAGVVLTNAA
jgi:hypothetical protein